MQEIWKDIKGFDGYYQVSTLGNVRSIDRKDSLGRLWKGKNRKFKSNNRGYLQVSLFKNGKEKYFLVHRLVADTFIENSKDLTQVNHKDQNNKNNKVDNLEWCSNYYNAHFGDRIERCGIKHRKPVKAIKDGEEIYFDGVTLAEKELSLKSGALSAAIRRHGTAGGYRFEYV